MYCGGVSQTLDHIQPLSDGGSDTWENRAPACYYCNHQRGSLSLLKWLLVNFHRQNGKPLTKRQRAALGLLQTPKK